MKIHKIDSRRPYRNFLYGLIIFYLYIILVILAYLYRCNKTTTLLCLHKRFLN
nr:MAG TPA: hypothetical protein [Caudoviricetes sp.]